MDINKVKQVVVVDEEIDTKSTTSNCSISSSCNSITNAEIIAAAFAQPSTSLSNSNSKNLKSTNLDPDDELTDENSSLVNENNDDSASSLSTQLDQEESLSQQDNKSNLNSPKKQNVKSKQFKNDSDDSLAETIKKVASGSISSDTTKLIEAKQIEMIKKSKIQERNYLKMQKEKLSKQKPSKSKSNESINQEETQSPVEDEPDDQISGDEFDEKDQDRKSSILNLKKKRHRRTKLEILRDTARAAAAADAAVASILSSLTESNNSRHKYKKKLLKSSLSSIDNSLKGRKFKLIHKDIQRKRANNNSNKKINLQEKVSKLIKEEISETKSDVSENQSTSVVQDESSRNDITESESEEIDNSREDYFNSNDIKKNLVDKQTVDLRESFKKESEDKYEKDNVKEEIKQIRKCLVCKQEMDQDLLNDHYINHFYESSKCCNCNKVSSNPTNFVVHVLTHLPSQFFCAKCDKWFRQPLVYRRHKEECSKAEMLSQENSISTRLKRKSSVDSSAPAESQEIKKRRGPRTRTDPTPDQESKIEPLKKLEIKKEEAKRRPGRPPKVTKLNEESEKEESIQDEESEDVQQEAEEEKTKRKYEKKIIKPDPNKKQRLRNFATVKKYNESDDLVDLYLKNAFKERISTLKQNRREKAKQKESNSEYEDIPDEDYKKKSPNQVKTKSKKDLNSETSSTTESTILKSPKKLRPRNNEKSKMYKELEDNLDGEDDQSDDVEDQIDDLDDIAVSDIELDDETISESNTDEKETNKQPSETSEVNVEKKSKDSVLSLPTLSSLITQQQLNSIITTGGGGTLANAIASLALKPSKDLSDCGTYRVKIQPRRGSNSSSSTCINNKKENNSESNLLANKANSDITATPSKLLKGTSGQGTDQTVAQTTYFECPECDKKFVSYFGLVQHYDHHPTLSVNCTLCEITFENHHALVLHNANVHQIVDSSLSLAKKNDQLGTLGKTLSKPQQSQGKNKNQPDEYSVESTNQNNDLSSLPSIMTRTSRQGQQSTSILNIQSKTNSIQSSLITSQAISNHTLTVKTSGFADLSFIDFSCINFPRIAQNYCELWPRKLNQSTHENASTTNLQPLHNYRCNTCGFYFPCIASLQLHQMKKTFASSKLIIDDESISKSLENPCQLFMTNSKYLDYEKTIDEIITKIELEEKPKVDPEDETGKEEFLKWFNLVDTNKLPANTLSNKPTNETNLCEKLFIKLRAQMLDINHQFIIDLDRWKYMHSNEYSDGTNHTACDEHTDNKIHLKPHVNLNRPLLIRSKKLKRNAQKFLLQNVSKHPISEKTIKTSITPVKQKPAQPIFSKPYFTSTTGNFSASMKHQIAEKSIISIGKSRKLLEKEAQAKEMNKKRKQKQIDSSEELTTNDDTIGFNEDTNEEPESKRLTRQSKINKRIKSEESSMDNYDEEIEDEDNEIEEIEQIEDSDDYYEHQYKKQNKKPVKRLQHEAFKLKQETTNSKIPAPPPLYKAPMVGKFNTTFSSTSANSSRLASASGMASSLPLVKNSMPKLQPIPVLTSQVKTLPIMPKLKPHNLVKQNPLIPNGTLPPPPQLLPLNQPERKPYNGPILAKATPTLVTNTVTNYKPIAPKPTPPESSNLVKGKSSENISLKCRFCMQIFKGQSEFFQHVITSHPKMVKQRLNRGGGQSTNNGSNGSNNSSNSVSDNLLNSSLYNQAV